MEQSINTGFEETDKVYLDRIEAYAEKGNIVSWKRERIFLRNFFLIWEFTSNGYSLVLRKQFANTHGEKGNILT